MVNGKVELVGRGDGETCRGIGDPVRWYRELVEGIYTK